MTNYKFTPQLTADGSWTFFSPEFGETFHSHFGAQQEAEYKFVYPVQLLSKVESNQSVVCLLDICYGLGYNTASALAAIWKINPSCKVMQVGLELDPEVPKAAIAEGLLNSWPEPVPELLATLATTHQLEKDKIHAQLLTGDARKAIQQLSNSGFQTDAIFLDPFSPPSCPQLWTVEFLSLVSSFLKPDGYLATYSCSAAVRTALLKAGLKIGSTAPVGRRSPGTVASFGEENLPPLSEKEKEHLLTRAGIPYRDPSLSDSAEVILHRRQLEQQKSSLEPTSHWKKRWS
ncbi:MnmC family methyltransferase [Okeania sp.]|uniref:tRNA (5-methylaminomethyl-2-thiouridine)(34)-methyltransferase MnmD n=1 Tax=Okeania sp. TaxID=3100323 RepID=UPI002B4B3AC3|nr:MnmC family methyltransferase [Okeania sp.]MEB3342688.1 MnmC family methyltransferase [Okeania sp.]